MSESAKFHAALGRALRENQRRPKGKKRHDFAVVGTHGNVSRGQMKRNFARFVTRLK